MKPVKLGFGAKRSHRNGGFGIDILHPGVSLGNKDSGIGAIGRIDHAQIEAGTVVRMHPHRDDEILSYMRSGTMIHRDTVGHEETLTNRRMMMMNAGHTFQHEERMASDIAMLQIFLRPRAPDLEPMVQFHNFDRVTSDTNWRMIAGPKGEAPLEVRADVWGQETHLSRDAQRDLPRAPIKGATRILYVFSGMVSVGDIALTEGESLVRDGGVYRVAALEASDLVLFSTDTRASTYKQGMFSGDIIGR